MNPVSASSAVSKISQLQHATQEKSIGGASDKGSFGDLVSKFIDKTNTDQVTSDSAILDFTQGKTDVQEVVLAMANADMSFQLFMQIRNNLIDSYNELMRMQF